MTKSIAAVLTMAAILGFRGAVREIAAPLDGLERVSRIRRVESPSLEPVSFEFVDLEWDSFTSDPPPAILDEQSPVEILTRQESNPVIESEVLKLLTKCLDLSLSQRHAIALWMDWRSKSEREAECAIQFNTIEGAYHAFVKLQLDPDQVKKYENMLMEADAFLVRRPFGGGYDIGGVGFTDIDEEAPATEDPPGFSAKNAWIADWTKWRDEAVAALPEDIRNNSSHRTAIDDLYTDMTGVHVLPERSTTMDFQGPTVTLELPEQRSPEAQWIAACDEWLNHVTATADAIDSNYLKQMVTTYGELVALGAPAPSEQDLSWRAVAIEAKLSRRK